ncbi:hypothetical protein [Dictyobacter aurantiacus]|uniref:Uncharacterized protein n=1 Tax=Dictyobacter aurantiacus TaxID=1936993 RepID=A0A401ZC66_9CHLR|nr:hypothetical protein [Dictyobacter aurantiacus]GCE04480.1 hypothetical protein KDAU_18090 [Dictyobacter aurantiacus]
MFSTLRQRIKYRLAHILYDMFKTTIDAQNWSQTVSCTSCQRIIPVDACFCAYCGIQQGTFFASPAAVQLQDTDPLLFEQVTIKLPPGNQQRSFLRYVRDMKNVDPGPATIAHRQLQDYPSRPPIHDR